MTTAENRAYYPAERAFADADERAVHLDLSFVPDGVVHGAVVVFVVIGDWARDEVTDFLSSHRIDYRRWAKVAIGLT